MKYKLKEDLKKGTEISEEFAKLLPEMVEKVGGRFKPEHGQEYWTLEHATFSVPTPKVHRDKWEGALLDHYRLTFGLVFETESEAEHAIRKLEFKNKLLDIANGWKPDWSDDEQEKYSIHFHHFYKEWVGNSSNNIQLLDVIYFETEEQQTEALELANSEYRDLLTK